MILIGMPALRRAWLTICSSTPASASFTSFVRCRRARFSKMLERPSTPPRVKTSW